ncbi:MAG TPA: hypothetical protein VGL82_13490 [Bryobacteraceae bacterium]|jgi:hypothetical protein
MRTTRRTLLFFVGLCCFGAAAPAQNLTYTFATIPADGQISGNVGDTIGWGYEIDNLDPADWLGATDLNAGSFDGAVATSVFDFPILAPGEDLLVPFDPVGGSGLYEVVWNSGTAPGSTNQGVFTLSAEWYDGDPNAGGNDLGSAIDQLQSYKVTLSSSSTPEPSGAELLLLGLAGLWSSRRLGRT